MNNLNSSLQLFEKIFSSEVGSKKIIQQIFQDVVGVTIPIESIKRDEFRLFIESHPVIKNEITLHEEELRHKIYQRFGDSVDSIR
jgi:hypothetical protein